MKALFRSPPVQAALTFLTWAYLGLLLKTVRWTYLDVDEAKLDLALNRSALGCVWHGTIPMVTAIKPVIGDRPARVLISLSADGEFITRASARLGLIAIRGSAAKKGKIGKGGAAALRACIDWLASDGLLLVTPDGPRGPYRRFSMGIARMAKMSGAPVYMIGLAAKPALQLKSWDRTQLPRPFGHGVVAFSGPFHAPPEATEEQLAQLCIDWAGELTAACDRAATALA